MTTKITCTFDPVDYATVSRDDEGGVDLTIHERSSDQSACIYLDATTAADMIAAIRTAADLPEVIEIPVSSLPELTDLGTVKSSKLPESVLSAPAGSAAFAYAEALIALAKHRHRVAEEAREVEDTRRDEYARQIAREAGFAGAEGYVYANLSPTAQAAVRVLIAAEEAAK